MKWARKRASCRNDERSAVRKLLKQLAPQAGFEPATLRLTGGKRNVSRSLRPGAGRCRIGRHRAWNRAVFDLRVVSRLAAVCRPLLLRKGKKRATSHERFPQTTTIEVTAKDSAGPGIRNRPRRVANRIAATVGTDATHSLVEWPGTAPTSMVFVRTQYWQGTKSARCDPQKNRPA